MEILREAARAIRLSGALPPGMEGFDFFEGEDDEPYVVPPHEEVRRKMERAMGTSPEMRSLAPHLRDGSLARLVGNPREPGRYDYYPRKRSWYVYVDAPKSQAVRVGLRIQKNLISVRKLDSSFAELRTLALYVGSSDGEITRLAPIKGADLDENYDPYQR